MAKSSQFSDSFSIPKSAQCQIVKKICNKVHYCVLHLLKVVLKLAILGQILFFVTVQCKRLTYLTSFFLRTKIIISPFLSPLVPE